MDLMTRAEFEQLVGDGEGTRVSLFVPTVGDRYPIPTFSPSKASERS